MTEPKFTKGPWVASDGRHNYPSLVMRPYIIEDGFTASSVIADCCNPDGDANSHLIAAAPELYEALSDLVSSLETEHVAVCLSQEIAQARAALAKARGDSAKTIGGGE
mgnify:FL=1